MKQKFMTITFSGKILEKKIEYLEIEPFRKLAKTFFFYQRYQLDILHKLSLCENLIFQKVLKSFKTFTSLGIFSKVLF